MLTINAADNVTVNTPNGDSTMVLGLNPFCGVHLDGITLTVNDPNANPDQLNYELIAPSGNRYPYIPGQLEDLKLALAYVNEPLNGKWQCRYVSGPCNGDGDNPCGLTQFMFDLRIPPGLATGPRQFNNEFLLQRMVVGGAQETVSYTHLTLPTNA